MCPNGSEGVVTRASLVCGGKNAPLPGGYRSRQAGGYRSRPIGVFAPSVCGGCRTRYCAPQPFYGVLVFRLVWTVFRPPVGPPPVRLRLTEGGAHNPGEVNRSQPAGGYRSRPTGEVRSQAIGVSLAIQCSVDHVAPLAIWSQGATRLEGVLLASKGAAPPLGRH